MLQSLNFYKDAVSSVKPVASVKKSSLVYNSKTQKPIVTVRVRGEVVPKKYYTLSGDTSKKNVGTYTVKATFNQEYQGFKGTVTVKSSKAIKKKLTKLKAKKRYYVRVRTYKKVGKTTYYSSWSGAKNIKTK